MSSSNSPNLVPPTPARPDGISRSSSTSSVKAAINRFNETLRPSVSQRDSQAELPTPSHASGRLGVPARPPNTPRQPSGDNVRSGVAGPVTMSDRGDTLIPGTAVTEVHVGQTGKSFRLHTDLLVNRSPYFKELFSKKEGGQPAGSLLAFPDLDEFSFILFHRWLYGGELKGPVDFHSMHHFLGLYIIATRFRIERLKNDVMDAVRTYYRKSNMTAPAYRLEYLYEATQGPSHMRRFLITTAAYRYLCEREPSLSDSMRSVISKGGELAVDFAEAMARLHQNELQDVRKGPHCAFHEHEETPVCKVRPAEPYE